MWAEDVTYKLTINASDFNTTSYAANNNEKTSNAVCTTDNTKTYEVKWTSYQVMKNGDNMQWQKSNGYIYNSTDLGTITNVTITSSEGTFTTYYGTSEQPSSGTTVGNGFFKTVVGSAKGTTSKVEVTFTISEGSSTAVATTTTIDATNISNTNVFTSTAAGSLFASVKDGDDNNVEGASVTWSGNNDNVATIDTSTGEVTLVAPGTVTFTASYAGVTDQYQASSATYEMTVTNDDPNAITLWSEDFRLYSANDVPSGGTYGYVCANGGGTTKIYNEASTGGTAPELLVGKSNGSFTAVVPLNQASGTLKLTYKTNAKAMSVSTTTDGISGGGSSNTYGEHTVTFTDVTTSMTSITIVFTATSGDNVRLDDIVLKGSAQPVAVEAPTFSINGGTYYSAQSVELACATEGATIYYSTNNTNWNEYENAITVSTTTTLYAKAVKDSNESTVSSITITIAEKNDVVFNIDDKSLAYGESYTIKKGNYTTADVQTDGNVTLSTSNEAVVSFSGMTITANAVGTADITITAAEGNTYKAGSKTITVTVTAPDAQATAPSGEVTTTFKNKDLEYDGTGIDWTASVDANSFESSNNSRGVQFGAAIGEFTLTASNTDVISKVSMVISTNGTENSVSVKVGDSDFTTTYGVEEGDDAIESLTLTSGMSKETVEFTGNASGDVVISVNDVNKSVYFKSITLTKVVEGPKVTLNGSGYATFCSQYPLDFTNASGYTAWQITDISSDNAITFTKITGSIKGGQGILLKGTAGETISLTSADSENVLSDNYLEGTLAPTYIAAGEYYGLSGNTFKKVNAGTVPAGKALLPADWITENAESAPSFSFIFNDGETTSIGENVMLNSDNTTNQWYDLSGRKLNSLPTTKGIYILNGKKVVVK